MTLALLQPVPAPNLYDLAVILQADRVILQDLERWSRKGRVHRSRIRTPDGTDYLSIPVRTEDRKKAIREVKIDQSVDWVTPILRSLRYNYRNSLYFDFYEPEIEADFLQGREESRLLPFVLHMRRRLFRYLELNEELEKREILSSELKEYDRDPDALARQVGANRLFQEHDARHYQRQAECRTDPEFEHPVYHQHFEGFEPWCSLYDLLFQFGPESFRIIDPLRGGRGNVGNQHKEKKEPSDE
ncbi:MAG: WbqC family protein [Balneolaceae bacterium]